MVQLTKSSRIFAAIALSSTMTTSVMAVRAAEPALTPLTAFAMALKQTPQMVQSRARIAEAQGAVKSAKGHLLPSLSASLTASASDNALNVFGMKLQQRKATFNDFGANQFDITNPNVLSVAPTNLNEPGWYRNYETKLQLNIPIYNGGQILGGLHQAQAMLSAAHAGQVMARQKLLFEVLRLYEGVRTANGYVRAGQQGVQAAQSYVDLTHKLLNRGVVAKTDVLQARIHLDDAKLGLAEAEKRQALATTGLRILTGLPDDKPIQLTPRVLELVVPSSDLPKLKRDALLSNPGLQALNYRVRAAQAGVTQARAAYLPHFNVMLSHQWDDNKLAFASSSSTIAGVLSWDVFDFGTRSGALDRAHAGVIQGRSALRQAQNQLRLKIDQAWQEVRLARKRLKLKHDAVTDAREAARLARLRYAQGLETFTQLIGTQAALDKARADVIAARYQQVMAQAGLLLASGRLEPATIQLTAAPVSQ
ncbi:MAG: TolC family protein [Gammaproteobacteria bacterium]